MSCATGCTRTSGTRSRPAISRPRPTPLTIGARFRDSGFKNGLVDDLRVYDQALTAAEVAGAWPGWDSRPYLLAADDEIARAHFLARVHAPSREARAALHRLRVEENRLIARVPELMVMEELPAPRPAHLLARGAYDAPRELVPRDTPASLPPFPADQPRNRLGLARWLTSRAESARRARRGQSDLEAALRAWARRLARGLRQPGPTADASRSCSTGSPPASSRAAGT